MLAEERQWQTAKKHHFKSTKLKLKLKLKEAAAAAAAQLVSKLIDSVTARRACKVRLAVRVSK